MPYCPRCCRRIDVLQPVDYIAPWWICPRCRWECRDPERKLERALRWPDNPDRPVHPNRPFEALR